MASELPRPHRLAAWLAPAAILLLSTAVPGCGDEPSLEDRLDDIQEEIKEAEPARRPLNLRLRCRDRHIGDPPAIQACIERGI